MKIYYIDSLPGSGKTFAIIEYVLDMLYKGKKVIIALPTKKLIQEVTKLFNNPTVITLDTTKNVSRTFFEAVLSKNQLIIITHAALKQFTNKTLKICNGYTLIIDETFDIIKKLTYHDLNHSLSEEGVLTKLVDCEDYNADTKNLLMRSDTESEWRKFMRRVDSNYSIDLEATKILLKDIKNETNLVLISKLKKGNNYGIAVLVNPSIFSFFERVVALSAFFTYSMFYHHFKKYYTMTNVTQNFDLRSMSGRIRAMRLYPLVDHHTLRMWSKKQRDTIRVSPKTKFDYNIKYKKINGDYDNSTCVSIQNYAEFVLNRTDEFCDKKILRVCNLDDIENVKTGDIIPTRSHGINEYMNYNTIALILSLNPHTREKRIINNIFPEYNITLDRTILTFVQNIARTSFRNTHCSNKVNVLVPNLSIAVMIKELFDGIPLIKKHALYDQFCIIEPCDIEEEAEPGFFKNGKRKLTEKEKLERKRISDQKYYHKKKGA